jgi:hypothetical protein
MKQFQKKQSSQLTLEKRHLTPVTQRVLILPPNCFKLDADFAVMVSNAFMGLDGYGAFGSSTALRLAASSAVRPGHSDAAPISQRGVSNQ